MKKKSPAFIELFRKFIEYHRRPDLPSELKKYGTIRTYEIRYHKIVMFLEQNKLLHIYPEQVTPQIAWQLYYWVREWACQNYSVRVTELCRCVLCWGVEKEIIEKNNLLYFKLKKEKPRHPVYLLPEEIKLLEFTRLSSVPLQKTADMFLVQCYTGLDYGDLITLDRSHIVYNAKDGRFYIVKSRCKSGCEAVIPFFDKTKAMLEQYNYKMPRICNGTYNRFLKEVATIVGIDTKLTSHVGRKTFTMIMLNYEGYSIEAVSKMSGHSSIRTTETYYAKANINLISREMDRLKNAG